jgi:hypothetical protein
MRGMADRRCAPGLVLALAACHAAPSPVPQGYESGQGRWGERVLVDAIVMPIVWIDADVDDDVTSGAVEDDWIGPGYGLRAAVGNRDQSIGLLVQGAHAEGEDTDVGLDAWALYLDFDASVPLGEGPDGLFMHAACGIGAAVMEFDDSRYDDVATGAINLRIDFEFRASRRFALLAGVGGFAWGWPGDTEAVGSFMELGGCFTF